MSGQGERRPRFGPEDATTRTRRQPELDGGFRLVIFEGHGRRTVRLPPRGELVIGRGQSADIRIADESVSRSHARLVMGDASATAVDLGSHNGSRINGERFEGSRDLRSGDVMTFGATIVVFERDEPGREAGPGELVPDARGTIALGDRDVVVADPVMRELFGLVARLAVSDLPVLVGGETGAGKDVVATALHHLSRRRQAPLVAINCASIPENLLESELFGHERGAFSGATAAKPGRFEAADGGTVFLDEVAELPAAAQAKLLRALETKRISRVGATRETAIDVRLVAATSADLEELVEAGRFRQDLLYRISTALVVVPPLRDRPLELPLLADLFLADACARAQRPSMSLSPAARHVLLGHRFPGNVRELKNLMDYLASVVVAPVIEAEDVSARLEPVGTRRARDPGAPPSSAPRSSSPTQPPPGFRALGDEVRDLERTRMIEALEVAGGNQTRAAELIGMPVRTFFTKVKQYAIEASRSRRQKG